ncbi:MAG: dUTP diphosphatase [Clostridiales bacterium]|nr:dUTP diphosphatase [Clostridiales bacterium]
MEKLTVKFIKLNENAKTPTFGTEFSAGADLYSAEEEVVIAPGETKFIGTGLATAIPVGTVGLIYARSGLACKKGLAPANKVGVIDSDYRGEIKVALHNHGQEPQTVAKNERVAQMVITPYYCVDYVESDSLDQTERGAGGFGSTGRK